MKHWLFVVFLFGETKQLHKVLVVCMHIKQHSFSYCCCTNRTQAASPDAGQQTSDSSGGRDKPARVSLIKKYGSAGRAGFVFFAGGQRFCTTTPSGHRNHNFVLPWAEFMTI